MTTQQPTGTGPSPTPDQAQAPALPAPAAEQQQQVQAQPTDTLAELTYREIPRFKAELRKQEATPETLQEALSGTVMSLLHDLGVEVYRLRGWAIEQGMSFTGSIDEVATRLEELEALVYGQDSQLIEQDAELFTTIASALEGFVEHGLANTHDPEGRQKLEEMKVLCEQAKARIEDIVIDGDDDGDGDDDTDEAG